MEYSEILQRRREFFLDDFKTLAEVGFDWDWITPIQKSSHSKTGPCVVSYYWLTEEKAKNNYETLQAGGFLPQLEFNIVLEIALEYARLKREDIYITQAFHLLPAIGGGDIILSQIDRSFDSITKYELENRAVIAFGVNAQTACNRHGIRHTPVCSPSAPRRTREDKAREIADALKAVKKAGT